MKSRSTEVALLLTVILAVLVFMLSCGTAPQNTTQNQNQNQGVAGAEPTDIIIHDPACDESNIATRLKDSQDNINAELAKDKQLKDGRVKVLVKAVGTGYLEAIVEGQALGGDELEDLSRILRKFMKKNCVLKVSFVPSGTIPPSPSTKGDYFEWSACEYPKVACPNGECQDPPCVSLTPPPGNANANANSNSNKGKGN